MSGEKGTERVLCTTSEEYARERKKEYMLWETCHRGDLNVLLEKTNLLLQKGDEHAREELMQLYLNEEIVKPYSRREADRLYKGKQCFSGIFDTDNSDDSNGDV